MQLRARAGVDVDRAVDEVYDFASRWRAFRAFCTRAARRGYPEHAGRR